MGFYGSFLLPVDLGSVSVELAPSNATVTTTASETDPPHRPPLYDSRILSLWYFFYWSTFFLSWFFLPVVQTYTESGFNTRGERLKDAMNSNVKVYAIASIVSVVLVILLSISSGSLNVLPLLMAIGNTYGLLLICLLLGYGLVDVPRRIWRKSNPEKELKRSYVLAPLVDADLFEAVWDLQDVEEEVDALGDKIRENER